MPSNKKRRIRERRQKTGESYSTAKKQLDAAITPTLSPTGTQWFDAEGRAIEDDGSLPQAEVVNVMDFDGKDLDKAWVPETAFDDPSMPKRPGMPPGTKRVLSLTEYIKVREKQTGWRLFSLKPHGQFMGSYLMAIISWDVRTKRERGER
jgi:hypothetical protein